MDAEIISLLTKYNEDDIDIEYTHIQGELFVLDIFTDIFQIHYDSKWIVSNINKDVLLKRL